MAPFCSRRLLIVFLFVVSAARSRHVGDFDAPVRQGTLDPTRKPPAFNGDCKAYARIAQLSSGKVMEAWNASLAMSYFLGLASLFFGAVGAVRTQVLGARGRLVLVACLAFCCGLTVAATLALVMRSVLAPVDATILGVNSQELELDTFLYCEESLGERWPSERRCYEPDDCWDQEIRGNPYLGKPPRDTWVFWLFVVSCYTGAIILLLCIVRVRMEVCMEDRMPRRDLKVIDEGLPQQIPAQQQA